MRLTASGNAGPLVFNHREPWKVLVKDPTNSDYALDNDCIVYTSKLRAECGYGDWRGTWGSQGI